MRVYVQSYIVQAEPSLDANGHNGYDVYYPDGRNVWMPSGDFEIHHRALDVRERMIMDMTSAEQLVMAVSDKSHINLEGEDICAHKWVLNDLADRSYCELCGADGDG